MKKVKITETELVLNADGSVYHLHLLKKHIAKNIILVGDPGRVSQVSKHFTEIEFKIENREFVTHTGLFNGKRFSAISTGIGTDNVDIVLNELYAATNINPNTRLEDEVPKKLNIVRLGTSGALHPEIPLESFLVSAHGLGFDGLMYFYKFQFSAQEQEFAKQFLKKIDWPKEMASPYFTSASNLLLQLFTEDNMVGITASGTGFYAPQGRSLSAKSKSLPIQDWLQKFEFEKLKITNFDMETSALYGLGKIFGFECCTINAIIANRYKKEYLSDHNPTIEKLILYALNKLSNANLN